MIKVKPGANNRIVFAIIDGLTKSISREIHHTLCEIGQENVTHAKNLIFKRKTGRIYVIKGAFHQASAPWEAPANLSGDLARNLGYVVSGHSEMEFGDKTQPGKAPYGLFLEEGTSKMKPRSHIKRTVQEKYKDTFTSLHETMDKALR